MDMNLDADPVVLIAEFLAARQANGDLGRLAATGHPEGPNRAVLEVEWIEEIVEEVKSLRAEAHEQGELISAMFHALANGDEIVLDWEDVEL